MFNKKTLNNILNQQSINLIYDEFYSTESDNQFLPDDRTWTSNVEDVAGGDNFADYCEYFFNLLDEEEYFES